MRDCGCCKRWMRATGTDKFDDFNVTILIHETLYTSSQVKLGTKVRIVAGSQSVTTDESTKGVYQQPVDVFVEQGTEEVRVELMDSSAKVVYAVKKLNIQNDILDPHSRGKEVVFSMKQACKTILNPKVKLTILMHDDASSMEQGVLQHLDVSPEASIMLRQQLHNLEVAERDGYSSADAGVTPGSPNLTPEPVSALDLLFTACSGPLEMFGSWGSRTGVWMAHRQPPKTKKHLLCCWKNKESCESNDQPQLEIDIMKILSVVPDPHPRRVEVFIVQYVEKHARKRVMFRRLDRSRDLWVEMLQTLIKAVHEQYDQEKKGRGHSKVH